METRLENYSIALRQLKSAVDLSKEKTLSELEKQGVIQSFEYTHELAWNTLKDYFEDQGNTSITGSKDAAREAFSKGIVNNGEVWMEMIKSRNKSSHTYNRNVAEDIFQKICTNYYPEFLELEKKLKGLSK